MLLSSTASLVFLALAGRSLGLETCGAAQYDPAQYVCYGNYFLCPIIAGEPLKKCGDACYSSFMYTCSSGLLQQLPRADGPFALTVSNPTLQIHGRPVTACGGHLWLGGNTCSYCPEVVPRDVCPPGVETFLYPGSGLSVMVPGGQQYYLDPDWSVGFTTAHSAYVPPGSTIGGFAAFQGGGFVNLNPTALGWVACYPTASGGGGNDGRWTLAAKNESNANRFNNCFQVNLKVNPRSGFGAWQYT